MRGYAHRSSWCERELTTPPSALVLTRDIRQRGKPQSPWVRYHPMIRQCAEVRDHGWRAGKIWRRSRPSRGRKSTDGHSRVYHRPAALSVSRVGYTKPRKQSATHQECYISILKEIYVVPLERILSGRIGSREACRLGFWRRGVGCGAFRSSLNHRGRIW